MYYKVQSVDGKLFVKDKYGAVVGGPYNKLAKANRLARRLEAERLRREGNWK